VVDAACGECLRNRAPRDQERGEDGLLASKRSPKPIAILASAVRHGRKKSICGRSRNILSAHWEAQAHARN